MDSNLATAIISAIGLIIVAAIGYLATRNNRTNDKVKELEEKIKQLEQKVEHYESRILDLTNENITLMKKILLT